MGHYFYIYTPPWNVSIHGRTFWTMDLGVIKLSISGSAINYLFMMFAPLKLLLSYLTDPVTMEQICLHMFWWYFMIYNRDIVFA